MKNCMWKHRNVLGLGILLLVQIPFILFKLTTSDQQSIYALVETLHILISSGLAGYLFSKTFESFLEKRLYGGLRRNWKEVRVMYSDHFTGGGLGAVYPREPTLFIQPPILEPFDPVGSPHEVEDPLVTQSLSGKSYVVTATTKHGPMFVSFNTGYVGQPTADGKTLVSGKWSDLQLMEVGSSAGGVRVGFPDTLIKQRKV